MTSDRGPPTAGVQALAPLDRTLPGMLRHAARHHGPRRLVEIGGVVWSHEEAIEAAARAASRLKEAGIARGDRVALMCSNRIEFLQVFLGCGWLGAVAVPVNTAAMGPQIEHALADSGARLLVLEAGFAERLARVDAVRCPLWQATLVIADAAAEAESHAAKVHVAEIPGEPAQRWRHDAEPAGVAFPEAADVLPGDPLAIIYTSGTTGPPKGVVCPHAQYHWWGVNTARRLAITPADVLGTTLPLFHINALNTLAQSLVAGCSVAYEARFSASGFWAAMGANQSTVIYVLGAMVPMLLAQPASAAERSHRVRIGLGPGVPAAAAAAFSERCGIPLLEGYGSTETNFALATTLDAPRPGTMGWVQPGFRARVVDEHDNELAAGEAGELVLRADEPFAFASGYHGLPQKTVEAWRNLWFHTGDRVLREADGAFRFIDRMKDSIRRRGENISSHEVEQALMSHSSVAVAAVYPVRSELAEDEVMAAVVANDGQRIDPAELVRHCEPRLPHFAIPRYLDVVAELPRTENGKVQKFKLIERGVSASTWQRSVSGRPVR